jgi:N-acylneuraminate cytidylyltransferase
LIHWTIEHAHKSLLLDRFVVSTEDTGIAQESTRLGAEVLKRPDRLAQDDSTTVSVLKHAVKTLPGYDTVVVLQPTSPIRHEMLIDDCIAAFHATGCDTLATGFISYHYEWGTMKNVPRQKMKGFFYDDGNVYVHKSAHLKRGEWWGKNRYQMVIGPEFNLEIDTEADLWMAEGILQRI